MIGNINQGIKNESTKEKDTFNLQKIQKLLQVQAGELADLRLDEDGRELVFTNELSQSPNSLTKITGFLFDHVLLLARIKQIGENEEIEVCRQPIPLTLLDIRIRKEGIHKPHIERQSIFTPFMNAYNAFTKNTEAWPITFRHLGKTGYELTLYASNEEDQKKWLELITIGRQRLRTHAGFFNTAIVSSKFFGTNKVNCAVTFDHGRNVLYGTDNGIYISSRENSGEPPQKVLEAREVTQVDVLEEHHLLLVLSNKTLQSHVLTNIGSLEFGISRSPKCVQNHCSFFEAGICMGRHMVSCVKSGSLSSTVKVFELDDATTNSKAVTGELRMFKEFYIPRKSLSVHFLKSKLCLACSQGFEVVSLETLETQMLLDQTDRLLDFALQKSAKPIHIERFDEEFLLNYSDFSFFVNRNGWRARPELCINWLGTPQSFALSYPWIFAFEPSFIEMRNIESGEVHIMPHHNIRMLHSNAYEILFTYEDERRENVVESIGFWSNGTQLEMTGGSSVPPT